MIRYKAIAPCTGKTYPDGSPKALFNGWTCGVRFQDGQAFFDDLTIRKDNKRTAHEAAISMARDFGYEVFILDADGQSWVPFDPQAELEPVPVAVQVPARRPRKAV